MIYCQIILLNLIGSEKYLFICQHKLLYFLQDKQFHSFIFPSIFLQAIFIFSLATYKSLKYEDYLYPDWSQAVGWFMAIASIICVPVMAIVVWWRSEGNTSREVYNKLSNLYFLALQNLLERQNTKLIGILFLAKEFILIILI